MRRVAMAVCGALLLVTGCAGMERVKYQAVASEKLPAELAAWKEPAGNQPDVQDTVIGGETYLKLTIGPCPSPDLKIRNVAVSGPNLWIEASVPKGKSGGEYYPTVYLKFDWIHRREWAPHGLSLQINGSTQPPYFDALPSHTSMTRELDAFKPAAVYKAPSGFDCTGDRK